MQLMLDILSISGPIYAVIFAGYLATRLQVFTKVDMRVFGKFVMNFALPALLFNALSQRPLREVMHGDYLLAYALGSLTVMLGGFAWARWVNHSPAAYRSYFAMGMSCSNSGYMGYPVAALVLGPPAAVALALNMVVENLLMLPLLLSLAERGQDRKAHWVRALAQMLARLLRNPMILAIVVGFACSLLGWTLPGPVARTVNMFAQATSGLALFVIGGTLVGLQIKGMRTRVTQIAVGKLIGHPLAVLLAMLWVVPVADPELRTAALLFAAMPMLGIYPLLAEKHGYAEVSAAALLVATLASFFTISTLLWVLRQVPV